MKVFVTGGTGRIGAAVVRALVARGHAVAALARQPVSEGRLKKAGAVAVRGDLRGPADWLKALEPADAVVHAGCTFGPDMGAVDRAVLDALLPTLAGRTLVYTGGCWLYGDTGGRAVDETAAFRSPAAFDWMAGGVRRVLAARELRGVAIHPAMVYADDGGGCLAGFLDGARRRGRVPVVGSPETRWPFVHADDLAALYVLALEQAPARRAYNAAGTESLAVGQVAAAAARHLGLAETAPEVQPVDAAAAELGDWARGYALDQGLCSARARAELGWRPRHADPRLHLGPAAAT